MDSRLSDKALTSQLVAASSQIGIGSIYRHYKGGLYTVSNLAYLEETMELCVVYQANHGHGVSFIRPLRVWQEVVDYDSRHVARFTKVEAKKQPKET